MAAKVSHKMEQVDPALRMTSVQLKAAVLGFRELFDKLRAAEANWTVEETIRYIYENDDDFAAFYTKQPSMSRVIMNPKISIAQLDQFVRLFEQHERGEVTNVEVARRLYNGFDS